MAGNTIPAIFLFIGLVSSFNLCSSTSVSILPTNIVIKQSLIKHIQLITSL